MNAKLQEKVDALVSRLDVDKNGKANVEDVRVLLNEQVSKRGILSVAGGALIAGLVVGFIAGRASSG